jgi:hypothetical protein
VPVTFDLYTIHLIEELYVSYQVTSEMVPSEAASMKGVLNKS